jgi:hypothetical protein
MHMIYWGKSSYKMEILKWVDIFIGECAMQLGNKNRY